MGVAAPSSEAVLAHMFATCTDGSRTRSQKTNEVTRGRKIGMSYVVLARKWRPTQFDDVVGQGHVARTLKNAIEQDRVAHAFLFTGARGVGKTSTARILAAALNCEKGPTPTPCGECSACTEIRDTNALDVFEIDGASNRGINEIRELRDSVRYRPSRDKFKIYIIDEVHMLTTEAFNALLKTLEEPPEHAKFIFATTEPQKIPVTILSRCQRYDFKRVGVNDIVDHLDRVAGAEGIEVERGALQIVARQAAGGMRDAVSLLDQIISFTDGEITEEQVAEVLGVANRKQLFGLSDAVLKRDAEAALRILDDVNRYGYDLGKFAAEWVSHLRDLAVVKVVKAPQDVTELTDAEIAMANEQVATAELNLLHRMFSVMADATQELTRSSFPKLIFEMTLVRMTQLEPLIGVDLLVDRLRALEEDLEPDTGPRGPENPSLRQPEPVTQAKPAEAPARALAPQDVEVERLPTAAVPAQEEAEAAPVSETSPPPTPQTPDRRPDGVPERHDSEPEEVLSTEELERYTPQARWKKVVEYLAREHRPLAMKAEHAWVERFEDGVVELAFAPSYLKLIEEQLDIVEATIVELFGSGWKIVLDSHGDPRTIDRGATLADEREAELQRRAQSIEDELRNHEVIREARDLFDVAADNVRVQVRLFDDSD